MRHREDRTSERYVALTKAAVTLTMTRTYAKFFNYAAGFNAKLAALAEAPGPLTRTGTAKVIASSPNLQQRPQQERHE